MEPLQRSKTLAISIHCSPNIVYKFVSNLKNLPKWATTFCKSIKKKNNVWTIDTEQGAVKLQITPKNTFGILDHYVSTASEPEMFIPTRVVKNGTGSEVLFTLFQSNYMTEERLSKDIALIEHDLQTLKKILEQ